VILKNKKIYFNIFLNKKQPACILKVHVSWKEAGLIFGMMPEVPRFPLFSAQLITID